MVSFTTKSNKQGWLSKAICSIGLVGVLVIISSVMNFQIQSLSSTTNNELVNLRAQNAVLESKVQEAKSQVGATILKTSDGWDMEETPIQNSISRGFRPVYVYSNSKTADSEVPDAPYAQVKQDRIMIALMKANDEKVSSESIRRSSEESNVKAPKYFVDLAANHAITISNTLLLEQNGWEGICIEGNPVYWYEHARYRKCIIVGAFVGGNASEDGEQVQVEISNGVFGGIIGEGMDNKKKADTKADTTRDLVSIQTIFKETNVPKLIDYFSLDVEGAESLVMADFPWEEYKFRFLTIERPQDDLKKTLEDHGYKFVKKIVRWGETVWMHEEHVNLSFEETERIIEDVMATR